MRYLRLDERLQLDGDTLLAMHRRAVIAIAQPADLLRRRSLRDAIDDPSLRDRNENERLARPRQSISRADGYRSARARSAEIVVHRRAMQYAKYYDRKNSDRESLTERDSTFLSMSPALRPMKESA
jgi:hypothetical protein